MSISESNDTHVGLYQRLMRQLGQSLIQSTASDSSVSRNVPICPLSRELENNKIEEEGESDEARQLHVQKRNKWKPVDQESSGTIETRLGEFCQAFKVVRNNTDKNVRHSEASTYVDTQVHSKIQKAGVTSKNTLDTKYREAASQSPLKDEGNTFNCSNNSHNVTSNMEAANRLKIANSEISAKQQSEDREACNDMRQVNLHAAFLLNSILSYWPTG